jgi:hypothetical protein
MTPVGSGTSVTIGAGPWKGEYTPQEAVGMLTRRYGFTETDGALGMTREHFRRLLSEEGNRDSQLFRDNLGRVFVKVVLRKIQAWDFSKSPIGLDQGE